MYRKSIEEIRKDLTKKQAGKFRKLLKEFEGQDKLDILHTIAKKRVWWVK